MILGRTWMILTVNLSHFWKRSVCMKIASTPRLSNPKTYPYPNYDALEFYGAKEIQMKKQLSFTKSCRMEVNQKFRAMTKTLSQIYSLCFTWHLRCCLKMLMLAWTTSHKKWLTKPKRNTMTLLKTSSILFLKTSRGWQGMTMKLRWARRRFISLIPNKLERS
jgi:hypothetical protein